MTPTPEQAVSWAREAGCAEYAGEAIMTVDKLVRFAALVDAHRAEQDAKLCRRIGAQDTDFEAEDCAAAILASVKAPS